MPEAVLTVVVVVAGAVVVLGGTVVVVAGRAVVDVVVVGSVVVVVLVDVVETDTSCNDSGTVVVVTVSASARSGSTPVSGPRTAARHDTEATKRRAIRDRLRRSPERSKESLPGRLVLTLRGSPGDLKNL